MQIYIDTSVINGLFAEDVPWIKACTEKFFKSAKSKYKLYISDIVADEIKRTPDIVKQKKLLDIVNKHIYTELIKTEKAEELAHKYIFNKIIPAKYLADALHIAIATIYKIPILVSWNFTHIVRHKTRVAVNNINEKYGHIQIDICSPEEVD